MRPTKILIHCSDSLIGDIHDVDSWHRARGFQRDTDRVERSGLVSVGYHFVVPNGLIRSSGGPRIHALDGAIQVGRDEDETGAHAYGANDSIGICLIGKPGKFTIHQLHTMRALVAALMHKHNIGIDRVIGHYETTHEQSKLEGRKSCPGLDMDKERARIARVYAALREDR